MDTYTSILITVPAGTDINVICGGGSIYVATPNDRAVRVERTDGGEHIVPAAGDLKITLPEGVTATVHHFEPED